MREAADSTAQLQDDARDPDWEDELIAPRDPSPPNDVVKSEAADRAEAVHEDGENKSVVSAAAAPAEVEEDGEDAQSTALKADAAVHAPHLRARPEPPPAPSPSAKAATSPRAAAAPTGPATCERCTKAGLTPTLRCFARVAERCRAVDGHNVGTSKWHHVSAHEHYCHDCVEHYTRGEPRKVWQAEQAFGKCSHKEVVVRLHLPCYAKCTAAGCGKWRALPQLAARAQVRTEARDAAFHAAWECAQAELVRGGASDIGVGLGMAARGRRKSAGSCTLPADAMASLAEPPEDLGLAVPFVVLGASEAEMREAVGEARVPWWDLSRFESGVLHHHGEECADLLSHPCRYVAVRNGTHAHLHVPTPRLGSSMYDGCAHACRL